MSTEDLETTYELIGRLYAVDDLDDSGAAMQLSRDLIERGNSNSWASVWWAYGALNFDLSDEAWDEALRLLSRVDHPPEAQGAAKMLTAAVEATISIYSGAAADPERQVALHKEALSFCPDWPKIHLLLGQYLRKMGRDTEAKAAIARAIDLVRRDHGNLDVVDRTFAGYDMSNQYLRDTARDFGIQIDVE